MKVKCLLKEHDYFRFNQVYPVVKIEGELVVYPRKDREWGYVIKDRFGLPTSRTKYFEVLPKENK